MDKAKKNILKRVFVQLKNYKFLFALTLLCALISVAGTLVIPIFFGQVIDLLVEVNLVDFEKMFVKFITVAVLVAATCVAQWLTNSLNNKMAYDVTRDMRNELFSKIQTLPLSYIDRHAHGDIVSRNIDDIEQFADGLLIGFTQVFTGALTIVGTLGIMIAINWIIALIVFVLTPLSLFVSKFIASKTFSLFKKTAEIRGKQSAYIGEMIGNLKVVKAFNKEKDSLAKFDEINNDLTTVSVKSTFYSSLTNPCTRFVNSVVYTAVALSGALMLILKVKFPISFSVGLLTSLLAYANQYTKPFNEIADVIAELQNSLACASRIYEIIDEQEEVLDKPNAVELYKPKGKVDFENLYFSYTPDKKLIENFNLNVPAGKRIAIVGPTGCGKTTLINLLMRFYNPISGKICVDNVNTADIKVEALRKSYGMVLQETWLKSGTIRDNIAFAKPNATNEEIENAAKAAHAHTFIMQLSNGYNSVVSEDGGNLSQGQKQLLCIARVMLNIPPMLILDEATSSIDIYTELQIQKTFAKVMKGRTSFVIAHRLSTIKQADIILVMNNGNIVEQGKHKELLALNGFYYKLYNSQFKS